MTIPLAIVNCTFNVAGTRAAVNWLLCLNTRCELAAMSERPLWTGCYVWTPAVALEVHARRKGPAHAATHQHYRGLVLRGNLTMSQYSDYNQLSFLVFFPLYLCRLFFSSLLIRPGSSVTLAWDASHDAAGIISYFKMCKFLTVHVGYRVFSAAVGSH